jgi:hypothetical protein
VFASLRQYQVLATCALSGLTIQYTLPEQQIRSPPSKESPRFSGIEELEILPSAPRRTKVFAQGHTLEFAIFVKFLLLSITVQPEI